MHSGRLDLPENTFYLVNYMKNELLLISVLIQDKFILAKCIIFQLQFCRGSKCLNQSVVAACGVKIILPHLRLKVYI